MIWKYRAVNNPVAKRKWLMYSLCLIIFAIATVAYRTSTGLSPGRGIIVLVFFFLVVFLFTVQMLGKERFYYMNEEIHYKPFKTKFDNIESFEVDEENKLIRLKLKKPSIFAVKTLYFDDVDEMKEAVVFLEKAIR